MGETSLESPSKKSIIHFEGNALNKLTDTQKQALNKYLEFREQQQKTKEENNIIHITTFELGKLQSILDSNNQDALSQFLEIQQQEYISTSEIMKGSNFEKQKENSEIFFQNMDEKSYSLLFTETDSLFGDIQNLSEDAKRNFASGFSFYVMKLGIDIQKDNGVIAKFKQLKQIIRTKKIKNSILEYAQKGEGENNTIFMNPKNAYDFFIYSFGGASEKEINAYIRDRESNPGIYKLKDDEKTALQKIGDTFGTKIESIQKDGSVEKNQKASKNTENVLLRIYEFTKGTVIGKILQFIAGLLGIGNLETLGQNKDFAQHKKSILSVLTAEGSIFSGKKVPEFFMEIKGENDAEFMNNIISIIGGNQNGFDKRFKKLIAKGGVLESFIQDPELGSLSPGSLIHGDSISNENFKKAISLYAEFEKKQSKNENYSVAMFVTEKTKPDSQTTENTTSTDTTESNSQASGSKKKNEEDKLTDNLGGKGLESTDKTEEVSYTENNPNTKETQEQQTETETIEIPVMTTQLTEAFFIDSSSHNNIQETNEELAKYGLEGGLVRLLMGYDNYINKNLAGFSKDIVDKIRRSIGIRTLKLHETIFDVAKTVSKNEEEGKEKNYRWMVNSRVKKQFEEVNNKILPSALLLHKYSQTKDKEDFRKTSMKDVETDDKNDFFDTRIEEIQEMFEADIDPKDGQFDEWGPETINQRNTLQIDEDKDFSLFEGVGGDISNLNINILNEKDRKIEKNIALWYTGALLAHIAIEAGPAALASIFPGVGTAIGAGVGAVLGGGIDAYDMISGRDALIVLLQKAKVIPEDYRRDKQWWDNLLAGLSILPVVTWVVKGRKAARIAKMNNFGDKELGETTKAVIEYAKNGGTFSKVDTATDAKKTPGYGVLQPKAYKKSIKNKKVKDLNGEIDDIAGKIATKQAEKTKAVSDAEKTKLQNEIKDLRDLKNKKELELEKVKKDKTTKNKATKADNTDNNKKNVKKQNDMPDVEDMVLMKNGPSIKVPQKLIREFQALKANYEKLPKGLRKYIESVFMWTLKGGIIGGVGTGGLAGGHVLFSEGGTITDAGIEFIDGFIMGAKIGALTGFSLRNIGGGLQLFKFTGREGIEGIKKVYGKIPNGFKKATKYSFIAGSIGVGIYTGAEIVTEQ